MSYIYELESLLDVDTIGLIFELLLITSCLSTMVFFLTKNENVSLLSSAPIFYLISSLQYGTTHLFFLIIVMLVQGTILMVIEHQSKKKLVELREAMKKVQTD